MMQRLLYILSLSLLGLAPFRSQLLAAPVHVAARTVQKPGSGDDKTLLVYPNPSTGIIQVSINGLEGRKVEIQVLNVIGTVMYRETVSELNERFTKTLDLSKFANGLYYVKIESDKASQMCKLVIR